VVYLSPGGVKTLLTVLGFRRLERWKPFFRIREDVKCETLNRQKVP
jgi:hypothetical protein